LINIGVLIFQSIPHEAAEAGGQWVVVDEEVVFVRGGDFVRLWMECSSGHDAVHVRVELELPPPGVKHAGEPTHATFSFGRNDVFEGGGTGFDHEIVELSRECETKAAQFARDGECYHKIRHGKEPGFLLSCPDFLIERATLRAISMIAAVVGVVVFVASLTAIKSPSHGWSPTRKHATHCPEVGSA